MEREIRWEKFKDPLEKILEKHKEERSSSDDDENDRPYKDSFERMMENQGNLGPTLVGPQGMLPLHEDNIMSRIYNFWIGHTNFGITNEIRDKLSWVDGVETLDIFTRYRFRIGIGRLFEEEEVKQNVEKTLIPMVALATPQDELEKLGIQLNLRYKNWCAVKLIDGKIQIFHGELDDVQKRVKEVEDKTERKVTSW